LEEPRTFTESTPCDEKLPLHDALALGIAVGEDVEQ